MSLVKCPECLRLCFSDSHACQSCSREFNRGELREKLAAENKAFDRKCYGVFLVLLLLVLIGGGYAMLQGSVTRQTSDSLAIPGWQSSGIARSDRSTLPSRNRLGIDAKCQRDRHSPAEDAKQWCDIGKVSEQVGVAQSRAIFGIGVDDCDGHAA